MKYAIKTLETRLQEIKKQYFHVVELSHHDNSLELDITLDKLKKPMIELETALKILNEFDLDDENS